MMIQPIDPVPSFDVAGPSHAFSIVFVHGAVWTRSMWLPQMEVLSDEFRVIAIDLPGHGVLRHSAFRLDSAIQAVTKHLSHETNDRTLIVGLSLGGYVAMACAHDQPQLVAGLILSGCSIDLYGTFGTLAQFHSVVGTTLFSEKQLTWVQEKMLRRTFSERLVEPQLKAGFSWKVLPQVYRELASHNIHPMLATFPGPVLIVNGENDTRNWKEGAKLLRATQDGQIQIIQRAGHLCNLEQPEAFTHQVRTFAKRLSEDTRR